MDNDEAKTNVRDIIKNFNITQQRVFRPKSVKVPTRPPRVNIAKPLEAISSSEDEVYDVVQNPLQKRSYLNKKPVKEEMVDAESDNEGSTSDEEDSHENPQFGQYLNVPEIVDETKHFLREEEDYCQLLSDMIENYIDSLKTDKFDDLFEVFGGINQICTFQNNMFLPELRSAQNVLQIAECFIKNKKLFSIYYERYFKNQQNMIFLMSENKNVFRAGISEEQYREIENILLKTINERILSYVRFLESMKKILVANVDVTDFDRAIAIFADLTPLFSSKDQNIRFVISEMVETERVYVEKLEKITEKIIPKIGTIIKRERRQKSIIGNVSLIHINQLNFYYDLEQCLVQFDPNEVANCFLQHESDFMQYVKDQQMKNDPDAIDECRQLLQQESEGHFDFHAPLTRLYKYKLLLAELKKLCDKGGVPSHKVQAAVVMITEIISKINGVAAINCIKDENLYLEEQGALILRNQFIVKYKGREYDAMVFLFEKSIIFTEIITEGPERSRRDLFVYRDHIITKRLSITVQSKSLTDFQVEFHGKTEKTLHKLKAIDGPTKNAWIDALNRMLMKQFGLLEEEKQKYP